MAASGFEQDKTNFELEKQIPYHVKVEKFWFRQKPVFTKRLSEYERQLRESDSVIMELNAGNMIYSMMRRLQDSDWEKQNALIFAYRNLVYKMSYVTVVWNRKDMRFLHVHGRKIDVMWALSFLTQIYAMEPLSCTTVHTDKKMQPISFQIQNGSYVGANAIDMQRRNEEVPDIWSMDQVEQQAEYNAMPSVQLSYDPNFRPGDGERFALPDGRVARYVSMDDRFVLGDTKGPKLDVMDRHNISASFMKDFEDMIRRQTLINYELYNTRYSAFMNKAHMLEHTFRGLDVSIYDAMPIAERGLPQAPLDTIERTNLMDHDSLKYLIDKVSRNGNSMSENDKISTMKAASRSVIARIRGYNVEYQLYQMTDTPEDLCNVIHNDKCVELYQDFAKLDSYGILNFPKPVYQILCNDPAGGAFNMTDMDRLILRAFGRGYVNFLSYQTQQAHLKASQLAVYQRALRRLKTRYLDRMR